MAKPLEEWTPDDETFTQEMVEDEFAIHERKAGQELPPLERERLLQLWLALVAERYLNAVPCCS